MNYPAVYVHNEVQAWAKAVVSKFGPTPTPCVYDQCVSLKQEMEHVYGEEFSDFFTQEVDNALMDADEFNYLYHNFDVVFVDPLTRTDAKKRRVCRV